MKNILLILTCVCLLASCSPKDTKETDEGRQRILLNDDWRFYKYGEAETPDFLIYEARPEAYVHKDDKSADTKPTEAVKLNSRKKGLKQWILPTANDFILNKDKYPRPKGAPGESFPFVNNGFDDSHWENVELPHDWAIAGPFLEGDNAAVGGGMGRLPSPGVAWYRKKLDIPASDAGRSIFIEFEGAMSYAMVWVNGQLVGGWPYGYASWQLDLSSYLRPGESNQLAVRLDNPPDSARWYPGGGLYRNVWLIKAQPIHVAQWGTFITTPEVSSDRATVKLALSVENDSEKSTHIKASTQIFELDEQANISGTVIAAMEHVIGELAAGSNTTLEAETAISDPRLWGPLPNQQPQLYVAVTEVKSGDRILDRYETRFGIRELRFDADKGLLVNDERIHIQGVNQHHDLGALGAAFNKSAAKRQLNILREMGVNAIRMAHNPPAPGLLELCDSMGFLVVNEIFDVWERKKTPLDFHLIFPDWHEADLRAFVRRDRNHPSVIMWSVGNEVGEQYTEQAGADLAKILHDITKEEDASRPTAASMNFAQPPMVFPSVMDTISLNYQGEGIRDAPAYKGMKGIHTEPAYPKFREAHPDKAILSSENAAALSSRSEYFFPVTSEVSAPVKDGQGGNPHVQHVSSYELYTTPFGSSADKVLGSLEKHPYVGGGFIWSGWDYLGEPTPYYGARSSYFGVIDLAGFKKDRFYLYQAHWRPDLPMVHILPHWNWPDRLGEVTPVHVFTSGDEVELFLNGKSLGKRQKQEYQYRLRWDEVVYEPGELKAVAYKKGEAWAESSVKTTGDSSQIVLQADKPSINADGKDLVFVSLKTLDENGLFVANANQKINFSLQGPGEIVATDNGDPTDMNPFVSHERSTFNGLALAIVKAHAGEVGEILLRAESPNSRAAEIAIKIEE